jgi:hypothetical protein
LALARLAPALHVILATSNPRLQAEVLRLASPLPPSVELLPIRRVGTPLRRAARWLERILPVGKLEIYGDNLDFFRSLDALVVAEKTSLLLKTRYGLEALRMVHTRHGAGDRAIGFDAASRRFDLVLASGRKIAERLELEAGVDPAAIRIVGYPKFDIVPPPRPLAFQANGRPTVLYNPHVSPHLSSWYAEGRRVLEYFRRDQRYNLIFSPHVMLFARPVAISIDRFSVAFPGHISDRFYRAPNIHIDLGSPACADMTYTNAADIYLGDVSSQVYEFLLRPRPCIFLDNKDRNYVNDPNFAHWAAGQVITDAGKLEVALRNAAPLQSRYLTEQRALFDATFDLSATPSSDRAALAVLELLGKEQSEPPGA